MVNTANIYYSIYYYSIMYYCRDLLITYLIFVLFSFYDSLVNVIEPKLNFRQISALQKLINIYSDIQSNSIKDAGKLQNRKAFLLKHILEFPTNKETKDAFDDETSTPHTEGHHPSIGVWSLLGNTSNICLLMNSFNSFNSLFIDLFIWK